MLLFFIRYQIEMRHSCAASSGTLPHSYHTYVACAQQKCRFLPRSCIERADWTGRGNFIKEK
jgi:hypothetical protein